MMALNESMTLGVTSDIPPIQYTFPEMSGWNFTAGKVPFNKAGMGGILNAADYALSLIFPHYGQYLNYSMDESLLDLEQIDIKKLVLENKGPLALVAVALVSSIIITLVGFGWCFLRCCCKDRGCCSRKSDEDVRASKIARKSDKYKRAIYGVFFAAFVILFTFGLVTCFVTNEQVKDNVNKLPKEVDKALEDSNTYIEATISQTNALLVDNYGRLAVVLKDAISRSGIIIKNGLSRKTGAEALNNLTDVVDTVENVYNSLTSVERTSKSLKDKADQLQNGLRRSKDTLLQLLERCLAPKCTELRNTPEIRSLRVENDFQNLPDMTELLRELGNFFGTNVRESIDRGRRSFDMLSIRIQAEVDPFRGRIEGIIDETGRELNETSQRIGDALREIPIQDVREDVKEYEEEIKKYAPYWYYAILLICCALTFIFLLMAFGIFVGFCGKQPGSEYSNECCSRKTGSSFINCGVFFIFLTFLVFTIVALVHFLLAGVGGQVVCEAISSMDNQTERALRVPKLRFQQVQDINYEVPSYSKMLNNCKEGRSAYVAFELSQVYNVEELKSLSERFNDTLQRLTKQVNIPADSTEDITFLTPETKAQINRFANSQITKIKFDTFAEQLRESITSVDLKDVIGRLKSILDDPNIERLDLNIKAEITTEIMFIETLEEKVLRPMINEVRDSVEHLRALSRDQKDLTSRIRGVAKAAEEAQRILHSGVTRQIRDLADDLVADIMLQVQEFADFTYDKITIEMGQCRPLYNAFNATVSAVCVNILSPMGGYWFGLSFLLILFIPILLIGCSLAGLYSKYKAAGYESVSYVHSATYYSSAYGDGDTIPLSLSANNARRHKRGRATEARYSNRFDDTSHKAWGSQLVFNNHHTPPASGEYERPPPYYYPGPAQS